MFEVGFLAKMRLNCCMKLGYIGTGKGKMFKDFANIMSRVFVQFDINGVTAVDVFQCKINCLEEIQLIGQIDKTQR